MTKEEFNPLYGEFFKRIVAFIFNIVGDVETAADIGQEVFTDLYLSLRKISDVKHARRWLHMTAKNKAIDFLRRSDHADFIRLVEENVPAVEDRPRSERPLTPDEMRKLLSEKELETIRLRYYGATFKEIGEVIGIPKGSVRHCFLKALEKLRNAVNTEKIGGDHE